MSSTPPKNPEEALGESWVDLTYQTSSPRRATPLPLGGEEYLRLLREAQRESNNTSARGSLASSRRDSPKDCISPKSPPNSPNPEFATDLEELRDYYLNKEDSLGLEKNTDWVWDWSSRPDLTPPKDWRFRHPTLAKRTLSIRNAKVGNTGIFSRGVLCTFIVTNILSLLLGAGLGYWMSKKTVVLQLVSLD
ncbi:BCL2/adenovirus E1B 19 kDa protein-interacting protein 3-like [Pollicipes pollicipes]|uniref:BCL2/adenovirus E1B 19 kDa protein-interacting protein 3-like n=1 Tax=Pollicipes pollicipes TaxID=41117 RepID=UPI001884AC51|nr:BCL2/adenovirus E1B 19 kDa protein-interacting protein 3-like [Pollicipes pollicipes]